MKNARKDYTPNREVAERFPEYEPPNPAKKFDLLWKEFVDAKQLAASTRKKWSPYFAQLIKRIGTDDMSRVTEQHLLDWRDALLASKTSRRNVKFGYIAAARAFFRWAKNEKKLPTNPGAEVFVTVSEKKKTKKVGFDDRGGAYHPCGRAWPSERTDDRGECRRTSVGTVALRLHRRARQRNHPIARVRRDRGGRDPVRSHQAGGGCHSACNIASRLTGDFSDARLIRKFGDVPDDLSAL
ncbi:hypothetical protein ACVWZK_002944 [Bradyrhizobium sp. GM0.4]